MEGMVAVVTGASRGIGKGVALALAAQGAHVVVVARTDTPGGRLPGTIYDTLAEIEAEGGHAVPVRTDVSDEEQVIALVKEVIEQCGRIDVLVNNAGVMVPSALIETQSRRWDLMMRVNLKGSFLMCKYVLPTMITQRCGSIINMTSEAAVSVRSGNIGYAVTKAGLNHLTLVLAEEVRAEGIAVNALNPGSIKTEGSVSVGASDTGWDHRAVPRDVGPACVFLANQNANTFTGRIVDRESFGLSWP